MMAQEGPRAAVDVRTWRPLDLGSETVEPGLTMIGQEAGLRHTDRVPAYLNNLYRLGLIWFSREPLHDQAAYQVLEAQPEVQEAMDRAGRAKTVRRSIWLTPFGVDFCETCLPIDTAEFLAVQRQASEGDGPRGGHDGP
jgi:abortive infection alpha-like protein